MSVQLPEYQSSKEATAQAVEEAKPKPAPPPPKAPSAAHHNRILKAGYKRADELEARMVRVLTPILTKAGRDAAKNFTASVTNHLAAAGAKPPPSVTPEELKARTQAVEAAKAELRTRLSDGSSPEDVEAAKQDLRDAQANLYVASSKNPVWSAPAPAEVLDVDALVLALRTKTEPVRVAMVESVTKASIEGAGVSFDVSNPYVDAVIKDTASQIPGIAATTQANVVKVIQASYSQGLSIPDTSRAIQVAMQEQSYTRAVLISRTTLAGATAGGSLAATKAINAATGGDTNYSKVWLVAPGAVHPRHEDYDGLDHQTQPLDGSFNVGDSQLDFPGDPGGPPEEVCNCRCTLIYQGGPDSGEEITADDS